MPINKEWYKDWGCNSEEEYKEMREADKREETRNAIREVFGSEKNLDTIVATITKIVATER